MKYKVLKGFYDKENPHKHYREGSSFPKEGYEVTKARIDELGKKGVIEVPKPKAKPKKVEPKKKDSK